MNTKVILTSVLLLGALVPATAVALTVPPLPNCDSSSNPNYNPTQTTHHFVPFLLPGVEKTGVKYHQSEVATVWDTSLCATGDGDNETGQGGAQFPQVSQGACDPAAPWSGHHNVGAGSTVTVTSNTGNLPMDYFAGTDGQTGGLDVATSPCTGNGVVSDSYDTDPFDCGQGRTGHFPGGPRATLAENPYPGGLDPWAALYGPIAQGSSRADPNGVTCFGVNDGSAWSFFFYGTSPTGGASTPGAGDITAP